MRTVLAALFLSGCIAGCGSGTHAPQPKRASPAAWSAALCGALEALTTDQRALSADYSAQATKIVSQPAVSRQVLSRAMDAVRADFRGSAAAVEGVGAPEVSQGTSIQAQVLDALRQGETLYAGVTARIQATAADGPSLAATLRAIGTDVARGGHALDVAFDGLDSQDTSGRLTRALETEPTCAGITG